jgi:cyclophilin family peptidyl-prolyl cis-trans isomerase
MNWIQRTLRALNAPVVPHKRRARLGFEELEDRQVPTAFGVIAGSVFFDANSDGVKGTGEATVPGVTVKLSGTTETGRTFTSTTTTRSDGTYQFQKLEPGSYQVEATLTNATPPKGVAGLLGGVANGNKVQTIILSVGQLDGNVNFGFTGAPKIETISPDTISLRLLINDQVGDPRTGSQNKVLTDINNKNAQQFQKTFTSKFITGATAGPGKVIVDGSTATAATGNGTLSGSVFKVGTTTGIAGIQVRLTGVDNNGAPYLFTATTNGSGQYSFSSLPAAAYFLDVLPSANFRAAGSVVGNLGGTASRADQVVPTIFTSNSSGNGYNFFLAEFAGNLDAGLANDVANGSLGTATDRITSDPSIRGRLVNPSNFSKLEARFTAGAVTNFVSVKATLAADGSFVLNEQTMRNVFGGGIPDGTYSVQIRATPSNGGPALTKDVTFTLKQNGPAFISPFANISAAATAASQTFLLAGAFTDPNISNSVVRFNTMKGTTPVNFNVELFDKDAPRSVANFFNYLGLYGSNGGVIFHRLHIEPALKVLQGGGFTFNDATDTISSHILQNTAIRNEYSDNRRNERGTIAWAKLGGDPNSATSEFFFNLDNANANTLNVNNNGGFAVFGKVQAAADLAAIDNLANATPTNAGGQGELPLVSGSALNENNIERITSVEVLNRDDELTYSATSSNTAVATVLTSGFQGNQLTVDFVSAGTTTITVTATDSTGNTATTSFIVTVTSGTSA